MTLQQWQADVDEELSLCERKKYREGAAGGSVRPAISGGSSPLKPLTAAPSLTLLPSTQRSRFGGTSAADLMWTVAFIAVGVATAWFCWRLSTSPEGL